MYYYNFVSLGGDIFKNFKYEGTLNYLPDG
jgi:hypothetical protein